MILRRFYEILIDFIWFHMISTHFLKMREVRTCQGSLVVRRSLCSSGGSLCSASESEKSEKCLKKCLTEVVPKAASLCGRWGPLRAQGISPPGLSDDGKLWYDAQKQLAFIGFKELNVYQLKHWITEPLAAQTDLSALPHWAFPCAPRLRRGGAQGESLTVLTFRQSFRIF